MPIYVFVCADCRYESEQYYRMWDRPSIVACPNCDGVSIVKPSFKGLIGRATGDPRTKPVAEAGSIATFKSASLGGRGGVLIDANTKGGISFSDSVFRGVDIQVDKESDVDLTVETSRFDGVDAAIVNEGRGKTIARGNHHRVKGTSSPNRVEWDLSQERQRGQG